MFYDSTDVLVVKCELGFEGLGEFTWMEGMDGMLVVWGVAVMAMGCLNRGLRRFSWMGSDGGEKGRLLWKEIFSRLEMVGGVVGLGVRLIGCDG